MFRVTNVTLESCTQAYATEFATMTALHGERALRPGRVAYLMGCVESRDFTTPTWAVIIDSQTGKRYRGNGQHSSTMLMNCPAELYPADLMVVVEEYTTDDLEHDAPKIFEIFDSPRSARTNEDVMNMHRASFADLKEVDVRFCVATTNGIAMFERGRKNGIFLPPRERGFYLQEAGHRAFILWAATFAESVHSWLFSKTGVVAEMVASYQSDLKEAQEFWQLVFTESHPDPDHETRELTRTLREWATKPRIRQDRFRKEAAKQWRRFRRHQPATVLIDLSVSAQDSASA